MFVEPNAVLYVLKYLHVRKQTDITTAEEEKPSTYVFPEFIWHLI